MPAAREAMMTVDRFLSLVSCSRAMRGNIFPLLVFRYPLLSYVPRYPVASTGETETAFFTGFLLPA